MITLEVPIFSSDLMRLLGIRHVNTLRRYIKDGKVPPPDKVISQKNRYWHRATLERAGLIAPASAAAGCSTATTRPASET